MILKASGRHLSITDWTPKARMISSDLMKCKILAIGHNKKKFHYINMLTLAFSYLLSILILLSIILIFGFAIPFATRKKSLV